MKAADAFTMVTSHHVFGVTFPCQRKAAFIQNSMRAARAHGRIDEVAFRGQQARRAFTYALCEGVALGVYLSTALADGLKPAETPLLVYSALVVCIDVGNAYRHAQTFYEAWQTLRDATGSGRRAREILAVSAKKGAIEKLARALEAANIDTQALRASNGWRPLRSRGPCVVPLALADCRP